MAWTRGSVFELRGTLEIESGDLRGKEMCSGTWSENVAVRILGLSIPKLFLSVLG